MTLKDIRIFLNILGNTLFQRHPVCELPSKHLVSTLQWLIFKYKMPGGKNCFHIYVVWKRHKIPFKISRKKIVIFLVYIRCFKIPFGDIKISSLNSVKGYLKTDLLQPKKTSKTVVLIWNVLNDLLLCLVYSIYSWSSSC